MITRRECATIAKSAASVSIKTTSATDDVVNLIKFSISGLEKELLSDGDREYKLQQAMLAQELLKAYIKRATQMGIL